MQLEWRKLSEKDEDYELIFGVCIVTAIFIFVVVSALVPERYIPSCIFARWTHIPCPTCGSYRALLLLKSGHLWAAFREQPLVVAGGFMAVVYSAYSWIVVLARKPRLRIKGRLTRSLLILIIALVLVNWLYLLLTHH